MPFSEESTESSQQSNVDIVRLLLQMFGYTDALEIYANRNFSSNIPSAGGAGFATFNYE